MKTNVYSLRTAALLAGGLLLFSANSSVRAADEKKAHGGEHGHADMAKPASSAAALETIHKLHAELAAQVKGKQLKAVHETCEKLTAAANALPAVSKDLPADKLKRVEGSVKNLAKALDTLHDAADDGNQANSEKHLKTVDSLLTMISSQYPAMSDHAKKAH
ncbi:MAG: hypothetical protein Q8N18_26120 [Opitutaceae bacterium]|nr:hypothetical protein [Opitutaceae bacterium]